VTKYWLCKRLAAHTGEALECFGGNGYVEESGMPRLYREAPLVSIWEGSGNVAALDTLRAMAREPESIEAFFGELDLAAGTDSRYDDAVSLLRKEFSDAEDMQFRARRIVEQMAQTLQASLLLRHGDTAVASAFVASRLAGDHGLAYGTLPVGTDTAAILDRARIGAA
jgi:putative acyl-CoA dehydrogenase